MIFFNKYKKAMIRILIALLMIVAIIIYSNLLKVVDYKFDNIGYQSDKALNIALITDLHACYYGDNQKWLIDSLKQKQPDVILLGGDIYDDKMPFDNADELLSQLPNIAPTYYVDGNHENWLSQADYNKVMGKIHTHGVSIIHGKSISVPNTNVVIHGISDPDGGAFDKDLKTVTDNLNNDTKNHVHILLTHRPEHIDMYLNYPFDIIMAGHAHGGQWRVPFVINGVYAPNQGLFPKYAGGLYEFANDHNTKFIVSRGLARESTRVPRLFNRPELVFVSLE
ncbi:metallophosphoesterase [Moraxella equi]|uniref:Uncharacterized metallophosphoesterase Cj0846 n=1 Tax=Moraxella equi TaxID=60442 RepID=A0A378QM09_9GAMM|nr:metallophosphoesterase [Moraxella equi]OPH38508.1 hypothetical protein B5J93_06120 [Moraxella equi]STZ01927.1 Uncharacterized metallophosphoesterase Cj0846 [Moraxella equi]